MATRIHRASKTRSNRPGWSVIFSHPRRSDARGRLGLKVRRGLGTADADRLVELLIALIGQRGRRHQASRRLQQRRLVGFVGSPPVG